MTAVHGCIAGVALLLALSGCVTAANTIDAGAPDAASPSHVTVNSSSLDRRIRFAAAMSRREGMILHAQVGLENVTGGPLAFEYRWEWTDADGFQLGDTLSNWQPGVVNAKERKMMSAAGPGPSAVNFRLHVREPL